MSKHPALKLGSWRDLDGSGGGNCLQLPAQHLVTHGVIVGMTGSGKTGLVTVIIEEALSAGVPTLVIDVKGDLPNLLLAFPNFDPASFRPWVEADPEPPILPGVASVTDAGSNPDADLVLGAADKAAARAASQQAALSESEIGERELQRYCAGTTMRVITPGASAGESLHVLSALERRSARWDSDPESARNALSAAISLVLRLLGRDSDPAKSREHVLLSVLAEQRMVAGDNAEINKLIQDLDHPPLTHIGALPINAYLKARERAALSAALNNLLASPVLCGWRKGASLDVGEWLTARNGRTPAVIVSVAHLDEEERALVLGVLLEEILCWVRTLPGSERLKALVVFDEVYGYLPPHPANPPTKRPLVSLMKQSRAFGVGVLVATQNPMDLDYRALSNAGLWCVGRLQTDADRARVLDGIAGSRQNQDLSAAELGRCVQRLAPRWFIVNNAHVPNAAPVLLHPRQCISLLRGPMTRNELLRARAWRTRLEMDASAPGGHQAAQ
jgi:hypothetical protein